MDLHGRPCSKAPTLPCVPEGGSFFAAAARAGERAPSETIERYAFPRVRRACASVLGSRKSLILNGFSYALVSMGGNDVFWGLRALVSVRCPTISIFLFVPRYFARSVPKFDGSIIFFACWKVN